MSWEAVIPPGGSLSPLQLAGLFVAALIGIALIVAAIKRRRARIHARARRVDQTEPSHEQPADSEREGGTLEGLSDDDFLKRAFSPGADEPNFDEIPSFTSLPPAGERSDTREDKDTELKNASTGDVSSLLFRLLGTKARILELERAERTKSQVLTSTREALESLKESLVDPSSELHEEIDEMHELIAGELSESHQSSESVQQLKEIIDAQYNLLNRPGAVYSADLLLAKRSYVESIDASLDRRLKNAERRETEFALGKERIMALKKQMLRLKESNGDSSRAH